MMKLWCCLCFFVLAISSLSRGENSTTSETPKVGNTDPSAALHETPPPHPADETQSEALLSTSPSPSLQNLTSSDTQEEGVIPYDDGNDTDTKKNVSGSPAVQSTTTVAGKDDENGVKMTPSMAMTIITTDPDDIESKGHSSWAYVILVFIILVIIVLIIILYMLRKVSRSYSFDLQRPVHSNHHDEPTGTFEPVYLDDLDRPTPKDQVTTDDLSPPPVANGTTLQSEEKGSNGDNATQEQPDANGPETTVTIDTSPSPGDELADKTSSPLSDTDLFFDAIGEEQQNENNNNPSVCSSDPFVEINLDDPAWCDQFLTSPEAPSSVLPFSPFSFSSSSSSS
ncbi:uncharacterized protein LOC127364439 isoform X2 [Dicentrarchus labrax]|uniref:uncharacterized protein LOC127364439 isoform X2 n=1 Tax=Dicentrarchus labrax TaxID=13489 RepID=UPI0021F53896|nr:uncharacterized protein LOC127364439 isoform X2 [Dicentrarchus labrax]